MDPLGKLDPEVEDLVLEIADDFIESVLFILCRSSRIRFRVIVVFSSGFGHNYLLENLVICLTWVCH